MTHEHHQIKNERGPWSWVVLVGAIQCFAISNPGFCVFDVVATVMGGGLGHTCIGEERGEFGSRNCCGLLLFCSTAFVTSSQTSVQVLFRSCKRSIKYSKPCSELCMLLYQQQHVMQTYRTYCLPLK